MSCSNVVSLIQGMYNPNTTSAIVPSNESVPSSQKTVRLYSSMTVSSGAPSSYRSGSLILDVFKGPSSIYFASSLKPGTNIVSLSSIVNVVAPVCAPWPTADSLKYAPNLDATFSVGRMKAMALTIESSTISTTSASLGGQFAASILASVDGLDVGDFSAITSTSLLPHSAISGIPAYAGLFACCGPFVNRNFGPLNSNLANRASNNACYTSSVSFPALSGGFLTGSISFVDGAEVVPLVTGLADVVLPRTGRSLDHGVFPRVTFELSSATYFNFNNPQQVNVTDVFVLSGPDGGQSAVERTTAYPVSPFDGLRGVVATHQVRAYVPDNGEGPNTSQYARYVGSHLRLQVVCSAGSVTSLSANIQVPGEYDLAMMGPKQVISWNSLNSNQTIVINGSQVVEVVSENEIAQYVTGTPDRTTADDGDLQLVKALFLTDGGLRLYMPLKEAVTWQSPNTVGLNVCRLAESNPKVGTRLSATGLFESMGARAGALAGGLLDNTFASSLAASGMSASGMSASSNLKRHRVEDGFM